jgi:hypothetical protein
VLSPSAPSSRLSFITPLSTGLAFFHASCEDCTHSGAQLFCTADRTGVSITGGEDAGSTGTLTAEVSSVLNGHGSAGDGRRKESHPPLHLLLRLTFSSSATPPHMLMLCRRWVYSQAKRSVILTTIPSMAWCSTHTGQTPSVLLEGVTWSSAQTRRSAMPRTIPISYGLSWQKFCRI